VLDLGDVQATPYQFRAGVIYNFEEERFIWTHSEICSHQVDCTVSAAVAPS
jgi:hypothetical protein